MKKLIAILLATSFVFAATAVNAAHDDPKAKKAAAKTNAGPKNVAPKQHVAPVTSHVQSVHSKKTTNLNNPKLNQTNVNKPPVRAHTILPSKVTPPQTQNLSRNQNSVKSSRQPAVNAQSEQLPAAVQANKKNAFVPNPEAIQRIRAQHANFKAKPSSSIASARFNQNYQIAGAQNWSGPQYQVFASYRPQWHDQGWWQSRYASNLLLIGGGWYYWDAGYWYPAWGYDEAASYYPYDGPIYVGDTPRPFDQVVADCQATLQEQGYYKGEVDGLMGPLTRQALAEFQRDHGLISTALLDQPTLSSLGLG